MKKREKIVFYIESPKTIGGGPTVLLDYASYLADNYDFDVYFINYPTPTLDNRYKDSNIHFCDVTTCDYSQFREAIFYTPVNYLFYLLTKIKDYPEAKIAVYFYHPHALRWITSSQIPSMFYKPKDILSFLSMLSSKKAASFMDKSNWLSVGRFCGPNFKERFDESYVPIIQHSQADASVQSEHAFPKGKSIGIGWLGRLDGDKIPSLINLLDNILALKLDEPVNVHIIGDGNAKSKIQFQKYSPYIRLVFTSYLFDDERDKYLEENCDLCLAMGISATVCGKLGIPTIVPIISSQLFGENKFVYLCDCDGYSLGWDNRDLDSLDSPVHTLKEVMDDLHDQSKRNNLSQRCAEYAASTFDIENCAPMMLKALDDTNLTVADCVENSFVRKQLKRFAVYHFVKKKDSYIDFHNFVQRFNSWFTQLRTNYLDLSAKMINHSSAAALVTTLLLLTGVNSTFIQILGFISAIWSASVAGLSVIWTGVMFFVSATSFRRKKGVRQRLGVLASTFSQNLNRASNKKNCSSLFNAGLFYVLGFLGIYFSLPQYFILGLIFILLGIISLLLAGLLFLNLKGVFRKQ